ncbi:MAG: hypothetical protein PHG67_08215 [Bacteroidales bacterium]|nr:hypothetical protein [Bacteroidales bacterium]
MSFSISTFILFFLLSLILLSIIILTLKVRQRNQNVDVTLEDKNELRAKTIQLKLHHNEKQLSRKFILPLKIQAMERLILYLERIQPQSLIKRNINNHAGLRGFHLALIQNVREEFEHNLAQQLYVSETSWQLISNAKEELIKQINLAVSNLPENAGSDQLASVLLTLDISLIQNAIQEIKAEFRGL